MSLLEQPLQKTEITEKNNKNNSNNTINLLSFGEVNLTLTLDLEDEDIQKYHIHFENLTSLEYLYFLKENQSLWKRIKLSSTNKSMQLLLQINKVLKNKIKIKQISFTKMKYDHQQLKFKEFLTIITNSNGLFLDSYQICETELSIQLRIRHKKKRKVFVLCGKRTPLDDDDENNESQITREADNTILEEGATKENDFSKISKIEEIDESEKSESMIIINNSNKNPFLEIIEICNLDITNFIYFCYDDYNSGKYKNVSMENIYEYIFFLKKNYKIRTILNLEFEINNTEEFRDLLSIIDICIYYDKNKLFNMLKQFKTADDKIRKEQDCFRHYYDDKLKQKEIEEYFNNQNKKYTYRKHSNKSSNNIINSTTNSDKEEENKCYVKKFPSKKNINLKPITKLNKVINLKPLNKIEMFNYYKSAICDKDPMNYKNEKIIIVIEELTKVFFIEFNKELEKPFVLDFDLQLYEKINIHNLGTIQEYKYFIKKNYEKYIFIFISYLLSSLLQSNIMESLEHFLFIGYYGGGKILKKIIELEKNENKPIPDDENFFYPDIQKEEINSLIEHAQKKKKEYFFILDCNNKNETKLKLYNPLLDKYISSYFCSEREKNFLKTNGFINHRGKILYDPVYKESNSVNKNEKFVKNEDDLLQTCHDFKIKNKCKMKENECLERYKNVNEKQSKFLVGFKKTKKDYEIYRREAMNSNSKLPSIFQNTHKKFETITYSNTSKRSNSKKSNK